MCELNAVFYPYSGIDTHSCMQEKERWCQGAFVFSFVFLFFWVSYFIEVGIDCG